MDGGRMQPRFALHPGYITSRNDGDLHYVSVSQLVKLYQLGPSEYVAWHDHDLCDDVDMYGRSRVDYIHLYPRYDGQYERPED